MRLGTGRNEMRSSGMRWMIGREGLFAALLGACTTTSTPVSMMAKPNREPPVAAARAPTSATPAESHVSEAPPAPPPLTASAPLVEIDLELKNAKPAVVSLPLGSTDARPVIVVTHGAGGRATTHCKMWRGIVEDRGFIVCPRGVPMYPYEPPHESGYYYDGHPKLAIEIEAALAALVATYGDRVDAERPVFAGYSQGANMGALVLPGHAARFGSAVLWEGGVGEYQEWNVQVARKFAERGGTRVLLACGRADCFKAAERTAHYMKRGGLEPQVVFVPGAGHTYAGELGRRVKSRFAWLVEHDDRWR
jgi:predicted esterase